MALVLTQRVNDGPIHIEVAGEHITIDLIGVGSSQARYAFTASDYVKINRDVVYKKIQQEKGND